MTMSLPKFRGLWLLQVAGDRKLPRSGIVTAIIISEHMNRDEGGIAWPGHASMVRRANIDRKTAIRGTLALERRKHLTVTRVKYRGKNLPNRYQPILFDGQTIETPEPPPEVRGHGGHRQGSPIHAQGSPTGDPTRVVPGMTPEPLILKPLKEPQIERDLNVTLRHVTSHGQTVTSQNNPKRQIIGNAFKQLSELLSEGVRREERASCSATSLTS
jgi:hypothetical protein